MYYLKFDKNKIDDEANKYGLNMNNKIENKMKDTHFVILE